MALTAGVQIRAGKHVASTVGVHGGDRRAGYGLQLLAVPDNGAVAAHGDGELASRALHLFSGLLKVVAARPLQRFVTVAENQINAVADHFRQTVAKMLNNARIGEAQGYLHAVLFCQRNGFQGGTFSGGGRHLITFDIQGLRAPQGVGREVVARQGFADAEKRVHGALGVGGDEHQAFAGDAVGQGAVAVTHFGPGEVVEVEVAVVVVGDAT